MSYFSEPYIRSLFNYATKHVQKRQNDKSYIAKKADLARLKVDAEKSRR